MFKCLNCNKEFKYESELIRHKERKILCNTPKKEYKCEICNINFVRLSHKNKHEKTNKHINNYNKINNTINNNMSYQNKNIELEKLNIELQNKNKELQNKLNLLENKFNELENKNKELENKNNELNNKFNLLEKLSNKESNNTEYIYIVHERTFVKMNANIYKIGKTKNIKNRLNGYSKGSKLLFTIPCINSSIMEKIILKYLKEKTEYIQAKEYGNEYFICDLNNLINDIHILVKNNKLENI